MSIANLRQDYARATLSEREVDPDPVRQFTAWLEQAIAARVIEPTAMTLATASADGAPSARMVLLKAVDERGFTFYTDYRSRKGNELAANPRAALVFWWAELERQVRVAGRVTRVTPEESEAYYRTRPILSRLGAWASVQSSVIEGRELLEARLREVTERFAGGEPPLPPHWGGFLVRPDEVELWQGRQSRLHDRIVYRRGAGEGWTIARLSP